jgi:hypothetical protein
MIFSVGEPFGEAKPSLRSINTHSINKHSASKFERQKAAII